MLKCPICDATNPAGTTMCRSCGAPIPASASVTADLEHEVRSLLAQGRKLEAAKLYMDQTGSSLKDAKDAVEAFENARTPPSTESNADLEADVLRLLNGGEKIRAVKLYRDRTGASLRDSKKAVEAVAASHGVEKQAVGCGSVAILVAVASAGIGVAAVSLMFRQ